MGLTLFGCTQNNNTQPNSTTNPQNLPVAQGYQVFQGAGFTVQYPKNYSFLGLASNNTDYEADWVQFDDSSSVYVRTRSISLPMNPNGPNPFWGLTQKDANGNLTLDQIIKNAVEMSCGCEMADANILTQGKIKIAGYDAYRVILQNQSNQYSKNKKFIVEALTDNTRVYDLTYESTVDQFDTHLNDAEYILSTFKPIPKQTP